MGAALAPQTSHLRAEGRHLQAQYAIVEDDHRSASPRNLQQ